MSTKAAKARSTKHRFRYAREDLAQRDPTADENFVDAYIERNKRALNASIKKARGQIAGGEYFTRDQVIADLKAQRHRRTAKK